MSITEKYELEGMKAVSEVVGITLKKMHDYTAIGMSTKDLDNYGAEILKSYGANSAPFKAYGFPGCTCISVNSEVAHGIPKTTKILKEGDLVNIDVSAELNEFWSDNGKSFVLGRDINNYLPLVNASKDILLKAINNIKGGIKISDIGFIIEKEAEKKGFKVIKNLAGHGVGRSLHEEPRNILNYRNPLDKEKFKKNSIVAIEIFISNKSDNVIQLNDGWTLVGDRGGFFAQHEHTIMITNNKPLILTEKNQI